ncbi:hypothetical protein BJX96DRAFT_144092 [Aspergillus floccosus]
MEILGAVSAGVTLFSALESCSRNVRKCCRDVQCARTELRVIRNELSTCRYLAAYLDEVTNPIKGTVAKMCRQHKLDEKIKEQGLMAQSQIQDLLDKMEPLRDGTKASVIKQFITKCKWHFFKEDIQLPMATLASVKSSLTLFTFLLLLDGKISEMNQTPKSNAGERLTMLKKIRDLLKEVHRGEARLQRSMTELQRKLDQKGYDNQTVFIIGNIKDIMSTFQEIEQQQSSRSRRLLHEMGSPQTGAAPMTPTRSATRNKKPTAATMPSSSSSPDRSRASTVPLGSQSSQMAGATHKAGSTMRKHRDIGSSSYIHLGQPASVNHPNVETRRDNPCTLASSAALPLKMENQSMPRSANPSVKEERKSTKVCVYHDYGDESRECYERDLQSTELPEESEAGYSELISSTLSQKYCPMPPFDNEDLSGLKEKRRRAGGDKGEKHSHQ